MTRKGFTLIELLIVIAILGVLAVVVLVAVNPVEQLAKTRDAGRISAVSQLGKSLQSYYVGNGSIYPPAATWAIDLVGSGDLSVFPAGIVYSVNSANYCSSFTQPVTNPTYCYQYDVTNGALVYSRLEASSNIAKCAVGFPYFVFSTADSRAGTICSAVEPTIWAPGGETYVD